MDDTWYYIVMCTCTVVLISSSNMFSYSSCSTVQEIWCVCVCVFVCVSVCLSVCLSVQYIYFQH